jgi:D-citramalate synthase
MFIWKTGAMECEILLIMFSNIWTFSKQPVKRVLLPDTLGVLIPSEIWVYFENYKEISNTHFDFHAHNDYDLSVANVMEAIKAGIQGLHTVNGMGERAETTSWK